MRSPPFLLHILVIYPYNFSNPIELNRYLYTANNPINAADPTGNQAFVKYSTADSTADEEGAALEPVGEEFASEAEQLVDEYDALINNAGDLGEETTNLLNIKGSPTPGTWSDYIATGDYDDVLAREVGKWVTTYPNLTPDEARALSALPNSNLAVNITQFTIPEGTTILAGQAASQTSASWAGSYAAGEGFQIYLSDPSVLIKIFLSTP